MENIKDLFLLLELFLEKSDDERQQKSGAMFQALFTIFPPETIEQMVNNLVAIAQERGDIPEKEKLLLLVFSKYLNVTLKMLYEEVIKGAYKSQNSDNLFS